MKLLGHLILSIDVASERAPLKECFSCYGHQRSGAARYVSIMPLTNVYNAGGCGPVVDTYCTTITCIGGLLLYRSGPEGNERIYVPQLPR